MMIPPIRKQVIFAIVILYSFVFYSQKLENQKYKLNLTSFIENETVFEQGLKISKKAQFYYEGKIRVNFLETGKIKIFNFFFSSWDGNYKEFIVKDKLFNEISPKVLFKDKKNAYIKKDQKKSFTLLDNSGIENTILSSMIVWLDNN